MLTLNKYIEIRVKRELHFNEKVCIAIDQQSERSRSSHTSIVTLKMYHGHGRHLWFWVVKP